jgi:hypothetical protein
MRFGMKMISNDLRRLYTMGLLRRRRVKRECRTRSGKTCFRGYEYKYVISHRGWRYLNYLADPEAQRRAENMDFDDFMIKVYIDKKVPEEKKELALWFCPSGASMNGLFIGLSSILALRILMVLSSICS